MKYTVTVSGVGMIVHRRPDGKFVVPAEIAKWRGHGTAWKPAHEPVVVAMKPLAGTFARNAVEWGVAGLNVDGGRIAAGGPSPAAARRELAVRTQNAPIHQRPAREAEAEGRIEDRSSPEAYMRERPGEQLGRYPSNLLLTHHPSCRRAGTRKVRGTAKAYTKSLTSRTALYGNGCGGAKAGMEVPGYASPDGTEEVAAWECHEACSVAAMDLQAGNLSSGLMRAGTVRAAQDHPGSVVYGTYGGNATNADTPADSGPASRFFHQSGFEPGELPAFGTSYCAKASTAERGGTRHPTIKPLELVAYLAKLLLPPARKDAPRRLLVPFSGAGSEMIGALRVGWEEVVGIEQEPEWIADAERRIRDDAPLWNQVEVVEREPVFPSSSDTDAEVTG